MTIWKKARKFSQTDRKPKVQNREKTADLAEEIVLRSAENHHPSPSAAAVDYVPQRKKVTLFV